MMMMMMNPKLDRNLRHLLPFIHRDLNSRFSSSPFACHHYQHRFQRFPSRSFTLHYPNTPLSFTVSGFHRSFYLPPKVSSSFHLSFSSRPQYSITTTKDTSEDIHDQKPQELAQYSKDMVELINEAEPELFCFCSGCRFLSMEDIQSYSQEYKKKLDEAAAVGDIPGDLALEVSSPDADRVLRIPHDLQRFKNRAMRVKYLEYDDPKSMKKEGIFFLESIEMDSGSCVWRLADVKENRDQPCKGRPLTRKQKDWRLKLPYEMLQQVTLYLDYQ